MATFVFSTIANGTSLAFDPALDILDFDQSDILPHDIYFVRDEDAGGSSELDLTVAVIDGPHAGKHIFLESMQQKQVTSSNFTFAAGGSIFIGDNTIGTTLDDQANIIIGTGFNDLIVGLGGNDDLNGGGGDDVFAFYLGAGGHYSGGAGDEINGGAGTDTLRFLDFGEVGATVNLATGAVSGGDLDGTSSATATNVEHAAGTIYADDFTGNGGNNMFIGRDGDDTLRGAAGRDTLEGGAGDDRLVGGDGRDWADYQHAAAGVDILLASGGSDGDGGTDVLVSMEDFIGSAFGDDVTGTAGTNVFDMRAGADLVHAGGGGDTLFGGQGVDRLWGGAGNDLIMGHQGSDTLWGDSGLDTLAGSGSSAFLDGASASAGRDVFKATSMDQGRDVIFAFDTSTTTGDANVDAIDLVALFNAIGYFGIDPIANGYMRIIGGGGGLGDTGKADAMVQIDADGGGNSWTTLFQVVDVSATQMLSNPDYFMFQ
jgi:Ca2+-binding RTX toxin-like protein